MSLKTTSSQTIGPYLRIGLTWLITEDLVAPGVQGAPIAIEGRVLDGDGKPVDDAVVEIWQANANGRYAHPEDTGTAPIESAFMRYPTIDCPSHEPMRPPKAQWTVETPCLTSITNSS